ncbi:hypothetical protein mRhiFer1_009379 [Rhinolophus ferrumequinum]|uniref:Uncharacterized protein n=1 Tax=Rhinolophus ferrumequinum TaxID=59479 RepID=A0A7J7RPJ4_RHIFE|nr:hypothetical protein mRhiFer1_009379 [Rhinolophus ferrumequinum]
MMPRRLKVGEWLVLRALPDPRTLIPYLCGLPAQGQPLRYWAGTFLSADEVRQGWPLTDLNPQCTPVLSQAQLGICQWVKGQFCGQRSLDMWEQTRKSSGEQGQFHSSHNRRQRTSGILRDVIGQRGHSRKRNSLSKGSEERSTVGSEE